MKQYGFWRHSQFPFVLGGPISSMRDDGRIETENYGRGFWFRPFLILPASAGQELLERLKGIEAEHLAALQTFNAEWSKKAHALMAVSSGEETS